MPAQQVLLNDALKHQRGQPLIPHALGVDNCNWAVAGLRAGEGWEQVLRLAAAAAAAARARMFQEVLKCGGRCSITTHSS
jgi:hypothetical protein